MKESDKIVQKIYPFKQLVMSGGVRYIFEIDGRLRSYQLIHQENIIM